MLTRTHYWYQHEPCWYVRKKNAPWFGKAGENSTVWDSASPKFIMGGSDEDKFDHPTQKPVELMRRPILNHTKRGEAVYDPFLGSGTTLAAAELTERVCYGIELDPKYIDVVVIRWQSLTIRRPRSTAMSAASTRSLKSATRRPRELPAAARRSRSSKRRSWRAIPTCTVSAARFPIGRPSCGSCKQAEGWPPLRHGWPTCRSGRV